MKKAFGYIVATAALALTASPVLADKGGNANNSKVNSNGGSAPAPAPILAGCGYTAGVVVQSTFYVGCSGFFAGNANSTATQNIQAGAIASLNGDFGGTWLAKLESGQTSGGFIDFGRTLYGETIVGAHFGNIYNPDNLTLGGQGNDGNVTVFWKFDFGQTGASGVQLLNTKGFSNAALYETGSLSGAVPEPQSWALFIVGFGALGAAMRKRHQQRLSFA